MAKAIANGSVIIEIVGDSKKFENSLKTMNALTAVAFSSAISAATTFGTAIVNVGKEFETSQKKVSTLFGDVAVDVGNLTEKVLDLSSKTGIAANELNEALYSALSAGVDVTEDMSTSMSFLETSSKLAIAGFTTTENAVGALAKVLNAYNMEASETDRVAKVLIQTQNKGITTVDELSAVMSQVTPTAAAMNVSIEQLEAGLAVLTAQGTKTAQATTELNSLFAELGKTGTKGQKAMAEALKGTDYVGKSFSQLMKEGVQLNDVLDLMSVYAEKNNLSLIDMFSSIEAGKAALSISSATETFNDDLKAMSTSADVVSDAYDKMTDTIEMKEKQLKESVRNIGISFYEEIAEPLKEGMGEATEAINDLGRELQTSGTKQLIHEIGKETGNLIVSGAKLAKEVFPPLLTALKWILQNGKAVAAGVVTANVAFKAFFATAKVTSVMSTMNVTGFTGMAKAMVTLAAKTKIGTAAMSLFNATNPVGWIVLATAAIAALGVAFVESYRKNDKYRVALEETNEALKEQTERMDNLKESAREAYSEQYHELENASEKATEYAEKIQALADADGTYKTNKAEVIALIDQMNEALGASIYYYDEETGRINNQQGAVENLKASIASYIELRKAQAVLDANADQYAQSLKDQAANKDAVAEAQVKLNEATSRYGDKAYEAYQNMEKLTGDDQAYAFLNLQESLGLTADEMSRWNSDIKNAQANFDALAGALREDTSFIQWYEGLEEAMEKAKETGDFSEISEAIKGMNEDIQRFDASKSIEQMGELKQQADDLKNKFLAMKELHDSGNGEALGITDQDVNDARERWISAQNEYDTCASAMEERNKNMHNAQELQDQAYATSYVTTMDTASSDAMNVFEKNAAEGSRRAHDTIDSNVKGPYYADVYVRLHGSEQLNSLKSFGSASYMTSGFGGGSSFDTNASNRRALSGLSRALQAALGKNLTINLAGAGSGYGTPTVVSNQLNFFQPIQKPSQVAEALEETSKNLTKGR